MPADLRQEFDEAVSVRVPLTPGLVGPARPDLAKIGKRMVRVHEHGAGAIIAARSASTNRKHQHNEIDCNGAA